MEIFYTAVMTLNAMCALGIMLSGLQKNKRHFLTLALLNVLLFIFHFFTWQLHTATTVVQAVQMSRYQTMIAIIALPFITLTFGNWCKFKYTSHLALTYIIISIPLLVLNFLGDSSLRFSNEIELIQIKTLFGKNISLLSGTPSTFFIGVHVMFITNNLFLSYIAYRFYRKRESFIFLTLMFFLISQLPANYIGYKIDQLALPLFYIGGLPLTVFSVICLLLISSMYKHTSAKLKKGEAQKLAIDKALNTLALEVSDSDNSNFYNKTAQCIQQLLKTKYVFIGLYCNDDSGRRIETLSVISDGELQSNFSYALKGTPCDEVVGKNICSYSNNVDLTFPDDALLTDMGVKAYIGLPLVNNVQEPLGIVCLLHDSEYEVDPNLQALLEVFGGRIGAELSRDNLAKKLKMLAYFDYVTKLPNRASLFEKINTTFKGNITNQSNSLLMLIDLDNFKEINKVYGYDFADDILKEIGHRLTIFAGDSIFVARNDGDEFAIIIDQLKGDKTSCIEVNWQAISAIIKAPIYINEQEVIVECSAGNIIYPLQTDDNYSVIRYAESALQQAKHNGRNQYAIFDKNIQAEFERQQIIFQEMPKAMQENGQLYLVYQPQTDCKGNVLGAEALIRWVHPEFGMISPAEFIPIIEQTELMHELGYWVIQTVFKQIQAWTISNLSLPKHISINISAKQLIHPDFVKKIVSLCHEYTIKQSRIVLELTESGILHDPSVAIASLKVLREHGFIIALDDFGTGYSSLSYLKDLPLDILKIDKSFIDDVFSPSTRQLIQSMFSISEHLQLDIIAEGMETKEQVNELVKLGCQCFQGYYFSKPLKPEDLIDWRFPIT